MVTNPDAEEPEPTPLAVLRRQAQEAGRVVLAGNPTAAVRRIVLYVVVICSMAFLPPLAAAVGLVALFLLALTDDYR